MKRSHGHVSSTPLFLQKKGRRQHGLLGTPVEGLTGLPVDTPDSEDRPQRAFPETTQRRLEGFCLSTPLSLSQTALQETPTLVKDQPAQHEDPTQQQPTQPRHLGSRRSSLKQQQQQQHPQHLGPTGLPTTTQGRHRLANISNLPPSPAPGAGTFGSPQEQQPDSSYGAQPMATGDTTGRSKRRHHVFFQPGVLSPQASLLAPESGPRTGAHSAAAGGAGAGHARTPYPSAHYSSSLVGTPGSCAGGDEDEDGFVLFTSQSYVRQSQPAISPSFAAGLSTGPEEEPTTTPSQDSREPRQSPSHGTTTTDSMAFDLPQQPLEDEAAAAALLGPSSTSNQVQDEQEEAPLQLTCSQLTAPDALAPGAAAGAHGTGSTTPGDGLGLLLHGGPDLEETTTPELEQIGIMPSQEGGSQHQLLLGSEPGAAVAAAAAGGGGSGSRVHAASAGRGRGSAAGGAPGSSGGRGARGPGVVCEEVTAKQMLFPVFRPLKERKCVILVRHGESTYNKQDTHGKSWADPKIFDAPLTQRGRQQAVAARERVSDMLKRHGHLGSTLWLSSPLMRALETMTLAAPQVEQLAAAQQGVGAPKVVICSLIAEHCATSGDVGRPASELRGKFPGLVSAMADLQEVWWHNPAPEDNPNCALTGEFNKAESIDCMRRRVSEFASWLRHRPEHVVVAFGHSTFWKYFANSRVRLRNCEVMQMWW